MTASRGHVHDADALFSTNLVLAHREGRSPLFSENREGFLLGNLASAKSDSRKLRVKANFFFYWRPNLSFTLSITPLPSSPSLANFSTVSTETSIATKG